MSSKELLEMFKDALTQEKDVKSIYDSILEKIEDQKISRILSDISADEARHIGNVERCLSILKSP